TVCLKDIPPFLMVSGNPAKPYGINSKGLRRRGFGEDVVSAIKSGYRCLYRSNNDLQTAIEELQSLGIAQKEVEQLASFVMTSDRGIVR
ncbi:MAG: acyl-[acyl-carrier-protein]--UDP-N-acetylglucosamine O-acyltransferase, partial [Pseudomonadota bacterium]|nr:acyl-[acyl-carrier-protein]--UDP-N-acetylglucosamine O-acyltransferase [Pseudomonadota bacterium]